MSHGSRILNNHRPTKSYLGTYQVRSKGAKNTVAKLDKTSKPKMVEADQVPPPADMASSDSENMMEVEAPNNSNDGGAASGPPPRLMISKMVRCFYDDDDDEFLSSMLCRSPINSVFSEIKKASSRKVHMQWIHSFSRFIDRSFDILLCMHDVGREAGFIQCMIRHVGKRRRYRTDSN